VPSTFFRFPFLCSGRRDGLPLLARVMRLPVPFFARPKRRGSSAGAEVPSHSSFFSNCRSTLPKKWPRPLTEDRRRPLLTAFVPRHVLSFFSTLALASSLLGHVLELFLRKGVGSACRAPPFLLRPFPFETVDGPWVNTSVMPCSARSLLRHGSPPLSFFFPQIQAS